MPLLFNNKLYAFVTLENTGDWLHLADICSEYLQNARFRHKTSEVEFKNFIEEIYFQIKKILEEEH